MTWLGRQTDLSFRLHGGLLRGREVHYSSLIRARRANQTGGEDAAPVAKRRRDETRRDIDGTKRNKKGSLTKSDRLPLIEDFYQADVDDLNICLTTVRTLASEFLKVTSECVSIGFQTLRMYLYH